MTSRTTRSSACKSSPSKPKYVKEMKKYCKKLVSEEYQKPTATAECIFAKGEAPSSTNMRAKKSVLLKGLKGSEDARMKILDGCKYYGKAYLCHVYRLFLQILEEKEFDVSLEDAEWILDFFPRNYYFTEDSYCYRERDVVANIACFCARYGDVRIAIKLGRECMFNNAMWRILIQYALHREDDEETKASKAIAAECDKQFSYYSDSYLP